MRLVVRSWNLFHGRTKPPSGHTYLDRMVAVVAEGADVVGLQEVPAWALRRLESWSGMAVAGAVARKGHLGRTGRRLTAAAPDLFRSFLNGQANAVLLRPPLRFAERQRVAELKARGTLERRICQLVPVAAEDATILVVNLHATAHVHELARAQLGRVPALVAGEERALVVGDFNVPRTGIAGFSEPIGGIDQILVRGVELEEPPRPWTPERRRAGRVLLSDHAPVEAVVRL